MPRILVHVFAGVTDCEIGEYLKDCTCMKSLADDLVVTQDQIADTQESVVSILVINYWLIGFVLLSIACLLLLVVIALKYYIKRGLTISYLLLY